VQGEQHLLAATCVGHPVVNERDATITHAISAGLATRRHTTEVIGAQAGATARVLYYMQIPTYSGAETAQLPILRADPDALVACPPDSEVEALVRGVGAETIALPHRRLRVSAGPVEGLRSVGRGVASALDLRKLLRAHPDRTIVYCVSVRPGLVASLASVGLRRRVVWVVPDYLPPSLRAPIRWLASISCSATLPLSQAIADDVVGRSGRLRSRTHVVYPGVDVAGYDASVTAPGRPRAAIVGHVSPQKRTDLAVEVARRVRRQVPDFELDVVGRAQFRDEDFALERELRDRVERDDNLRGAVHFHEKVSEVGSVLAQCGLLLHCRDDEPFGMVLIEAMAAGLPVVAPARGGPLEIVVNGETGFLYPPGDTGAATEAVLRLIQDRDLAVRMGDAARRRVEECFASRLSVDGVKTVLAGLARYRRPVERA
jgi:glycosyltransferase involved in cell wall biosynthesis